MYCACGWACGGQNQCLYREGPTEDAEELTAKCWGEWSWDDEFLVMAME